MKGGIQDSLIHRVAEFSLQLSGQDARQSGTAGGNPQQQQALAISG